LAVLRIVRKAADRAGIELPISPHWFRHAPFACLDRSAPIHLVQATLGHASITTPAVISMPRSEGQLPGDFCRSKIRFTVGCLRGWFISSENPDFPVPIPTVWIFTRRVIFIMLNFALSRPKTLKSVFTNPISAARPTPVSQKETKQWGQMRGSLY
jgi:hypothetical protein